VRRPNTGKYTVFDAPFEPIVNLKEPDNFIGGKGGFATKAVSA